MSKGYLEAIHPVLPVKDVLAALKFYVEKLGFHIAFADDKFAPRYAGVRRDAIEIHIQWHDASEWEVRCDRPMLRLKTQYVQALFFEYQGANVFHEATALRTTDWGTLEFAFYDLDRNGLTFYRDI